MLLASACFATEVDQSAQLVEQRTAAAPLTLRVDLRLTAAKALKQRHAELSAHFVKLVIDDLKTADLTSLTPGTLSRLAAISPAGALSLAARMQDGGQQLIAPLLSAHMLDDALPLYRAALAKGKPPLPSAAELLRQLSKKNPTAATALFDEIITATPVDKADSSDLWRLIYIADAIKSVDPNRATKLLEQIIARASAPDFAVSPKIAVFAKLQMQPTPIEVDNPRDAILAGAGWNLRQLSPDRYERLKENFTKWDLTKASGVPMYGRVISQDEAPERDTALNKRLSTFRATPDPDRAKLAIDLAQQIGALPAGPEKTNLALNLAGLSTEGDLGKPALTTVAKTVAHALHEDAPDALAYTTLAELVYYEHLTLGAEDPLLEAAESVLVLQHQLRAENDFTLTSMDGKTYSLSGLRGKIVFLNFWATWCAPCRKEMPDMETLHRRFEKQGLVVLAVSDEDRDTVAGFLAKQKYTFPVLLDAGRKANTAFGVDAIPKTFIFNRDGKLVAEAMDMRTESQFLDLLKTAGLQITP